VFRTPPDPVLSRELLVVLGHADTSRGECAPDCRSLSCAARFALSRGVGVAHLLMNYSK
jgi:hypothetical protein